MKVFIVPARRHHCERNMLDTNATSRGLPLDPDLDCHQLPISLIEPLLTMSVDDDIVMNNVIRQKCFLSLCT